MQVAVIPKLELSELTALTSTSRSKLLFAINMISLRAEGLPPKQFAAAGRKLNEFMRLAADAVGVAALMSAGIAIGRIAFIRITFGRIALRTIALRRVKPKIRVYRINRFHLDIQIEIVVCHKYILPSNVKKFF